MKWRSKATGTEFNAFDSWTTYTQDPQYRVTLRPVGSDKSSGPYLTYQELIEAFEKVEDDLPTVQ